MQGTVESQITPFPSPLKKQKVSEEQESIFWEEHNTVHGFVSYWETVVWLHTIQRIPPISPPQEEAAGTLKQTRWLQYHFV